MIFSSIPFLFFFLPCVFIGYYCVPDRYKNAILLVFSLLFYAWGEPKYILLMVTTIIIGYVFGLAIEKNRNKRIGKWYCVFAVSIFLLNLGFFKYADFFIDNIMNLTGVSLSLLHLALPIGISFYTFQIISYIVDVYRGEKAMSNIIDLGAYIAMFPQLIAGPIVRYQTIHDQLHNRIHSMSLFAQGVQRFIIGLSKKILLANQFGIFVETFKQTQDGSVLYMWMYVIAIALQIYFDFSGYSDMAIGLGKMFGFHFLENFNYPFIANSITDFWRRWHISLGTWFKDYVYIPLGGNRVSVVRQLLNILIVWFLTGFWHGAAWNFILWGLYFGILLVIEKFWLAKRLKNHPLISHIYVLVFVSISFVIFDASSLESIFNQLKALFGLRDLPLVSMEALYYLKSYGVLFVVGLVAATPLFTSLYHSVQKHEKANTWITYAEPLLFAYFACSYGILFSGWLF